MSLILVSGPLITYCKLRVGAVAEAAEGEQQLQERGLPHQAQGHHT